jgi:hypothetical protein
MTKSRGLRFPAEVGVCLVCGAPIRVRRCRVARGADRYCSESCRGLAQRQRVTRTCAWCGREFAVPVGRVRHERTFCGKPCQHAGRRSGATVADAFWLRVGRGRDPERDCWSLAGDHNADGYPLLRWAGTTRLGHRASYELNHGPIPSGKVVMHLCNRPSCVNPAHLRVGTRAENNRYMFESGRAAVGEQRYNARATAALVRELRRRYAAGGVGYTRLAQETGLSKSAVVEIVKRTTWKHVD